MPRIVGKTSAERAAKEFGKQLAQLRKAGKITQQSVAERLGVFPVTVSRWENGKRSPDEQTIRRLANLYGQDEDELVRMAYGPFPSFQQQREQAIEGLIDILQSGSSGDIVRPGAPPSEDEDEREALSGQGVVTRSGSAPSERPMLYEVERLIHVAMEDFTDEELASIGEYIEFVQTRKRQREAPENRDA